MEGRSCDSRRPRGPTRVASVAMTALVALGAASPLWAANANNTVRRLPALTEDVRHPAAQGLPVTPPQPGRYGYWNEQGVMWYANWRSDAVPAEGLVQSYDAMFDAQEDPPPAPPGNNDAPVGPPTGAGSGLQEGQTLGEAPVDDTVQFLRQQSVLLGPGDFQFDYGFSYATTNNDFPLASVNGLGAVTGVTEVNVNNRLLIVPFEFRYGYSEKTQLFLSTPVGWSNSEVAFDSFDSTTNDLGIADCSFGASVLICDGEYYKPDIIGTLSVTAPTGNADYPLLTSLIPNSTLGQGFWAGSANLLFVHTYDPVVLYWGFGYGHRFDADFANPITGLDDVVNPGEQAFYQFGFGFGVNEWITLSTNFAGQYITEMRIDGDLIEGTNLEPMRLRFAITVNCEEKIVEPFAEIGMTDDSVNARVGITWTCTRRNPCNY
jgi:hypothetical protein